MEKIVITPETMPREKMKIFKNVYGKKVKITDIGKSDTYHEYNLKGVEGVVHIDGLYQVRFDCDTDLEAHGLKSNVKNIYFSDVTFEVLN